jgi:hypothetical protein
LELHEALKAASGFPRRLNGDENDQGKAWRFDGRQVKTEKVTLYRFE